MNNLCLVLLAFVFCEQSILGFPNLGGADDKVIYGVDDRMDICESPSQLFASIAVNAVAAMVDSSTLGSPTNGAYSHLQSYRPLGPKRGLCSNQKFFNNPTAAMCSGTLIAPDRILTAGHCISDGTCGRRKFVFDYMFSGPGCSMPSITEDDVYSCTKIKRVENDQVDFAVVYLDRPVIGRVPVQVATAATPIGLHEEVAVIGFGSGIPAKIDMGGRVIDPRAGNMDYFVASTDTFAGNSGSGVFNTNGVLVGILVRGQVDYVRVGSCYQVNVVGCTDELCSKLHDAEEITYAHRALEAAPDCKTHSQCSSGNCARPCPADSDACTGWCM